MNKFEYERIDRILWREFESARKARDETMGDIPGGGTSCEFIEARQKLTIATERLNAFVNHGIIPDDLQKKPPLSEGRKITPQSGSGNAAR